MDVYRILNELSSSVKLTYNYKDKMSNEMNKRMSPVMDSYNQGYRKIYFRYRFKFYQSGKFFKE